MIAGNGSPEEEGGADAAGEGERDASGGDGKGSLAAAADGG